MALTPETTQQRSPDWFAIRSSLKVTGSIDCTGADQHHVETDGEPSSALHVSLQMGTTHI